MTRDLQTAIRGLRRSPTIFVAAVACLALGIGATTAIASAIDRALLQPLPFRYADRLVTVYRTTPHFDTGPFSPANYVDLAAATHALDGLAAVSMGGGLLTLPNDATRIRLGRVTGNFFPLLGVTPLRGRTLGPIDETSHVIVLSEELWQDRFAGDPSILGRGISLGGEAYTVVGIMPRGFQVPHGSRILRGDAWVPILFSPAQAAQRRSNYLTVLGRLAPNVEPGAAQGELLRIFAGIVDAHPELRGESLRVLAMRSEGVRSVKTPLLLLFGAVAMVLLIATTNVASLLLARGVQRNREVAVRTALGATRWGVMRPILTEALVIVACGLVCGLALGVAAVRTIGALAAERLPQLDGLTIDLRIVVFAVLLSAVVALVCAAAPAWRATAADPQDALRGGRGGGMSGAQHRSLGTLVVVEIALSLVLVLGAGLVLRGFARLMASDPGFDASRILTLETSLNGTRYGNASQVRRFLEPALVAIRRVPGVREASSITVVPYDNWGWNFNIRYEGQPGTDPTRLPLTENRVIDPAFFGVTGQRLLRGRLFTDADDERPESPRVIVVNEALVRRDFAGRDPLGKRIHESDTTFSTIVGVVSDIRNRGPFEAPGPEVYRTYRQSGGWSPFPIMVRVAEGDPAAVARAVREAIRGVDPEVAVTSVRTMPEVIAQSVGRPRFYLVLLGVFAGVAVVLALAGIYGVLAYAVAQRTREFGIRTALGSSAPRTLGVVVGRGMRLVAGGLVLGLVGGFAATRLLVSLLYGVSPLDATTWMLSVVALTLAAVPAMLVPAFRATRVEPMVALRTE